MITSRLLALYLRFVFVTSRWTIENEALRERLIREPCILVFWHARLAAMPHIFRRQTHAHILISSHRDGELIARAVEILGFATVRGSTARQKPGEDKAKDKGGAAALRAMIRILKNGGSVGITPDGPRGPRMRVSPGSITLAALSGVPIFCASYSSSRAIRFRSWDRFLLPLPFGHFHVGFAGPLTVPGRLDDGAAAQARRDLEIMLNGLTDQCDQRAGQELVAPAAASEEAETRRLEEVP